MIYVLQVLTGREEEVAEALRKEGLRCLLPREHRLIRTRGSWMYKDYCLFPGYLFVEMTYTAENYYRVKRLPGVEKLLGDPRNPSFLSFLEVEWLRALTGKDNEALLPSLIRLREDGTAEILSGPLRAFQGRILKLDARNRRASCTISILGEEKEVTLSVIPEGENIANAEEASSADAEEKTQEAT